MARHLIFQLPCAFGVICVAIVDASVPDLLLSFGGPSYLELGIGDLRESMLSNDSA